MLLDVRNLWAGTGHALAQERPAAEVVAELTATPDRGHPV
jgi:hypothetical protein